MDSIEQATAARLRQLALLDTQLRELITDQTFTGPIAYVIEATDSLIELTYAGSNQASTNPEADTAYSDAELDQFITSIGSLIVLIRLMAQ